jgi:uncharacterized protein Yka (UPF0111/DUF47 family)
VGKYLSLNTKLMELTTRLKKRKKENQIKMKYEQVISMLEFFIDNIFVSFGRTLFSRSSAYQWLRIVPLF